MSYHTVGETINLQKVKEIHTLTPKQKEWKKDRDAQLRAILSGEDDRILLVIGPCSAHDEEAVVAYGKKLSALQEKVKEKIFLVMRVYTNKPRTNGEGYKGMLHSSATTPNEANFFQGVKKVRKLHHRIITECNLTTADELLYPESFEMLDDLVSYLAIGARSVEDQQHRFVSSMVDVPVGMKNPTSGNLNVLFNALHVAQKEQHFLFHYDEVVSSGNPYAHIVLRGGQNHLGENIPNYYFENLLKTIEQYENGAFQNPCILIDTNHDNSGKKYLEQIRIVKHSLINRNWNDSVKRYVKGFMIESFLEDGADSTGVVFGKSVTDPCLGWEKTEKLVEEIFHDIS